MRWFLAFLLISGFGISSGSLAQELPQQTTGKLPIVVVDPEGQPVPGAQVIPWALGSEGVHGHWEETRHGPPLTAITNEQGECEISYPRIHLEHFPTNRISVRTEHPDFCIQTFDIQVGARERFKIQLKWGTRLRIGITDEQGQMLDTGARLLFEAEWPSRSVTSGGGGWFTTVPLPLETTVLFAVHFREHGPIRFGGPYRWNPDDPSTHEAIVPVFEAIPLRGKLSENVPRPVLNGQVNVQVTLPQGANGNAWRLWTDLAKVEEDGSFEFPSLPLGADAQLIAMCDGFLSEKPGLLELAGVTHRYAGRPMLNLDTYPALPVVVQIGAPNGPLEIRMREAYPAKIRVVDPDGSAVADAEVTSWPNQCFIGGGSSMIGDCYPSREILNISNPDWVKLRWTHNRSPMQYRVKTDANGIAVLKYFPPATHSFAIEHQNWELPLVGTNREVKILVEGETHATITVQPKAKPN